MQAVCIIGSPKNNGSTSYVVDKLIEGMKENNIEVKRYCLGDMNINFCCGCKKCYEKGGKCVQKDDMDLIMKDVIESDIVVIASPSYWGDITGQLKVFFDRNTPYGDTNENRRVIPSDKKGIAIAIRAGKTDRENIHILESIEHYFGHLGIIPISRLSIKETDTLEDLLRNHKKEIDEAYEIGKNIKNLIMSVN